MVGGGDWNRRWGQTTAPRQSKSISEYGSRRIQEILPGLGEGEEDLAAPFNNAPDKLFNTHLYYYCLHPFREGGFRSFFFKPQNTPSKIIFILFPLSNLFLTLCLHCVFVSTCIRISKIRTPQRNSSPHWLLPSLLLLPLQHRRIVH